MMADVLYYPSIEFQSEDWVKRALLYWDRVQRIVPDGYVPNDSPMIHELKDNGLILDVRVEKGSMDKAAVSFLRTFKSSWIRQQIAEGLPAINSNVRVHADKVTQRLWDLFKKIGYTVEGSQWANLPVQYVAYYMLILANTIAESKRIPTATDNEDCWSINPFFKEKGNFSEFVADENAKGIYSQLIFEDIFPANLAGLSTTELIGFCESRKAEKEQLRGKIDKLIDRIQLMTDRAQIQLEANDLLAEIETTKSEFVKSQEFSNSGAVDSALTVGLPIAATLIGGSYTPQMVIAGILIGGYAAIKDYSKTKKNRNKSYQSYLVGVDKAAARNLNGRAQANMDEIIND